jgi:hypothetical protein
MILCTEILRSTREKGREEDFKKLRELDEQVDELAANSPEKRAVQKARKALQDHIQRRNVGVYGSITLRSDGDHMEISFRLEAPRQKQLWEVYRLRHDPTHGWVLTGRDDH